MERALVAAYTFKPDGTTSHGKKVSFPYLPGRDPPHWLQDVTLFFVEKDVVEKEGVCVFPLPVDMKFGAAIVQAGVGGTAEEANREADEKGRWWMTQQRAIQRAFPYINVGAFCFPCAEKFRAYMALPVASRAHQAIGGTRFLWPSARRRKNGGSACGGAHVYLIENYFA